MVDIAFLNKKGVSSGAYRKIFAQPSKDVRVRRLINTIASRIKDGRTANLREFRTYWAIDLAHETPFAQTTPTLVQNLLSRKLTAEQTEKELASWGLSEKDLFLRVDIPNGFKLILNPPVFYQIMIPIVRAYHTARTSMIYNERDRSPLFPFVPIKQTDRNRVLCDIWTDISDTVSTWYGYPAYLKQAIQQMLKYGVCLAFPMEEWHCDRQVIDGKTVVQKEGLRYDMPHPTRMRWDLFHPLPTINTDTGCEFAFHWSLARYGDILDNRMYWNRKAILHSSQDWFNPQVSSNFFKEVYPCNMRLPVVGGSDATQLRREQKASFYSTGNRDDAVFLTKFFWKIVPRDWGLGEYKYPVWHRFDVANDDTIIWAEPCAYNPIWFMGYDWDSAAGQPSSLSLETIPWQDQLGNILSQMVLTAKQNLTSVTFYDKNLVNVDQVKAIENLGEQRYRSHQFVPFDSIAMTRAGIDPRSPFYPVQFQQRSIVELQSMMNTTLNIMERVLQFTAQETGAAASHYQSAKEIGQTAESSSQRRQYTASGVDEGIDAWKRQIVDGSKAYMENDIVAQVSTDIPNWIEHIKTLGFSVEDKGMQKGKVVIKGKMSGLPIETFARTNVGPVESADPAIAQIIFQTVGIIAQKPEFLAEVGVGRVVKLLEQGAKIAGAPADFDISSAVEGKGDGQMSAIMQQITPILQQLQKSTMEAVQNNVAKPAAENMAKQEAEIQQLSAVVQKLEQVVAMHVKTTQAPPQPIPVPVPQPPQPVVVPSPEPQPVLPPQVPPLA